MPKTIQSTRQPQPDLREPVSVRLPLKANGEKGVFVSVNNYRYFVPRGQTVQVPLFIAKVLENSMRQDEQTLMLIENLTRNVSE